MLSVHLNILVPVLFSCEYYLLLYVFTILIENEMHRMQELLLLLLPKMSLGMFSVGCLCNFQSPFTWRYNKGENMSFFYSRFKFLAFDSEKYS